eukprot:418443-Rhodomonas_salina.1
MARRSCLELPAEYQHSRLHDSFNFDLLKRHVERPAHLRVGRQLTGTHVIQLLDDGRPDPEIAAIVDQHDEEDGRHFLVAWVDADIASEWMPRAWLLDD